MTCEPKCNPGSTMKIARTMPNQNRLNLCIRVGPSPSRSRLFSYSRVREPNGGRWGRTCSNANQFSETRSKKSTTYFGLSATFTLVEEMSRSEDDSRINDTNIAQPAIFGLQVALAELWKSWGIVPSKVVGHSVGEVARSLRCRNLFSRRRSEDHLSPQPPAKYDSGAGQDDRCGNVFQASEGVDRR